MGTVRLGSAIYQTILGILAIPLALVLMFRGQDTKYGFNPKDSNH